MDHCGPANSGTRGGVEDFVKEGRRKSRVLGAGLPMIAVGQGSCFHRQIPLHSAKEHGPW